MRKSERRRLLGKPRRRGKDRIEIDFKELRMMVRFGQNSSCSEQGEFNGTSETVMNICTTRHVATLLSDWGPVSFTTSSLYHEVTYSLRNVSLSTCKEWRTTEAYVTAVLLQFVHNLVLVTTKDSAPLLLAAQTLQFQIMGDKIKGILRVITEYCVRVLCVNLKLCTCEHIRHLHFRPWTHSYGT